MQYQDFAFSTAPELLASNRYRVGMLLYPGLTLLDLIGPQTVLSGVARIHLIWKTRDPIKSDTGVVITPDTTFQDCPDALDVLFVPGGPGQIGVLTDPEALQFITERGAKARYVTAVCTGSIILGAAGLLGGYRATSHWLAKPLLEMFGARPADGRVVIDRNRITGGGVTAGIDFGLTLLRVLVDANTAQLTQLAMEYDPAPPFDCGSPERADEVIIDRVRELFGPLAEQTAKALRARLSSPDRALIDAIAAGAPAWQSALRPGA